jgi:hypothetical protein
MPDTNSISSTLERIFGHSAVESHAGFLAMIAALIAGVLKITKRGDELLNEDAKHGLAQWLYASPFPFPDPAAFAGRFVRLFDNMFGPDLLSFRFLSASNVLSVFSVLILGLAGYAFNPVFQSMVESNLRVTVFLMIVLNLAPSYLAAAKTRLLIGVISRIRSKLLSFILGPVLFALDVGLSLLVFFAALLALELTLSLTVPHHTLAVVWETFHRALDGFFLFGHRASRPDSWFGVLLYSTLATSAIAAAFYLTVTALQIASASGALRALISRIGKVEAEPLSIVGYIMAALLFVISVSVMLWGLI